MQDQPNALRNAIDLQMTTPHFQTQSLSESELSCFSRYFWSFFDYKLMVAGFWVKKKQKMPY